MKIKLFGAKGAAKTEELEQELVLAGLLKADRGWQSRDKVTKFTKASLEDIKVYWDKLPKSIKTRVFDSHVADFDAMIKGTYQPGSQSFKGTKPYRELLALGLEKTFMPDRYGKRSKSDEARGHYLVTNHPTLFVNRIEHMDHKAQINVLKAITESAFYLLKEKYWTNYLKKIVADINNHNPYTFLHDSVGHLFMLAVDLLNELTGEIKWFPLYESVEKLALKAGSRESEVFEKLVGLVVQNDTESFMAHVKAVAFKKKHRSIRASAYKGIIKAGFLDEKIARRIRSDSSERVSTVCIKALFSVLDNYENKDELLGQFLDTRYDRVGCELVEHSPDKYLPFLVGVKGAGAKRLLEQRMNEAAKKGTL